MGRSFSVTLNGRGRSGARYSASNEALILTDRRRESAHGDDIDALFGNLKYTCDFCQPPYIYARKNTGGISFRINCILTRPDNSAIRDNYYNEDLHIGKNNKIMAS